MSVWPPDGVFRVTVPGGNPANPYIPVIIDGGTTGVYFQPPRGFPSVFPLVTNYVQGINSAGNTAIWTPAGGNRFNLLGFEIFISGNASIAGGGSNRMQLTDGAGGTVIFGWQPFMPATASAGTAMAGNVSTGPVNFGMVYAAGALSPRALQFNLNTALSNGTISVSAYGFETT